jgi:hypothetical protein
MKSQTNRKICVYDWEAKDCFLMVVKLGDIARLVWSDSSVPLHFQRLEHPLSMVDRGYLWNEGFMMCF